MTRGNDSLQTIVRFQSIPYWMQRAMELYGPYLFGVVALLILWFAVVVPDIKRRDSLVEKYLEASKQLSTTATSIQETSRALAELARAQAAAADRLERMLNKLDK